MKPIKEMAYPLAVALIAYLFSLHVDFLNVKAKVLEHDRGLDSIARKLDKIDSKLENIMDLLATNNKRR